MSDNTSVSVGANGPYGVSGDFQIVGSDGQVIPTEPGKTAWLCRCGQSATKPFCDGTHKRVGFTDPGVAQA